MGLYKTLGLGITSVAVALPLLFGAVSCGNSGAEKMSQQEIVYEESSGLEQLISQVEVSSFDDSTKADMVYVIREADKLLQKNRRTKDGYTFTIPSAQKYVGQWLWDSCFQAEALGNLDIGMAEKELTSLMASQWENGMVPHKSKYSGLEKKIAPTSKITQPPFIARATLDVYMKGGDKEFLEAMFPKLQDYCAWIERERMVDGVVKYINPIESGEDNSIIWDTKLEDRLGIEGRIKRAYGWFSSMNKSLQSIETGIKSVTATAVYADSLECMAQMAGELGNNGLKEFYTNKKAEVIGAMKKEFKADDGLYYNKTIEGKHSKLLKYKTHAIFDPLFCGALTQEEAKQLVNDHLLNQQEFWTNYPIPTVAVNEPKFSEVYWRGPVWVNMNWMLQKGLLRCGFNDLAEKVLKSTVSMIKENGFNECYSPKTGAALRVGDFGWTTVVVDMIQNQLNYAAQK